VISGAQEAMLASPYHHYYIN